MSTEAFIPGETAYVSIPGDSEYGHPVEILRKVDSGSWWHYIVRIPAGFEWGYRESELSHKPPVPASHHYRPTKEEA